MGQFQQSIMAPALHACPRQGVPAIVAEILKHEKNNTLFSAVNYAPLTASLLMRGPEFPALHLRIESKQPCLIPDTIDSPGRSTMTVFEGGRHIRTSILHRAFNQARPVQP